jgi:hypothetical protein
MKETELPGSLDSTNQNLFYNILSYISLALQWWSELWQKLGNDSNNKTSISP